MIALNVVSATGSRAERSFRARLVAEDLVPGLPPTPAHDLVDRGGRTIRELAFANFYLGGSASWQESDRAQVDHSLAAAMADAHLNNVLRQYFGGAEISSDFLGSRVLPGAKPRIFSQGDAETLAMSLYASKKLRDVPLATTVLCFMLPRGTVLTTDEAPTGRVARGKRRAPRGRREDSSLEGLGGYHGSVHPGPSITVYYAVGVYSERQRTGDNGIVAFDAPWKNIVATFYHELCEARTDPDVEDAIRAGSAPRAERYLGWVSRQGEECGDFPVFESARRLSLVMREVPLANGSGTVPVQFQYSNAVHGPEGPIAEPHRGPR